MIMQVLGHVFGNFTPDVDTAMSNSHMNLLIWAARHIYQRHCFWSFCFMYRLVAYSPTKHNKTPLEWRHNERYGVSYHRHLDRLLSRLFRRTTKKTSKAFVRGIHRPVDSPHQGHATYTCSHSRTTPDKVAVYVLNAISVSDMQVIASRWLLSHEERDRETPWI